MTPEEITKLAEEYGVDKANCISFSAYKDANIKHVLTSKRFANEAMQVLTWLLRTHCIVSKEKATELCRLTLEHGDSIDYGLIDGLTDIVCDIFSEQYHQVAEGLDNPEIAKEVEG